MTVTKVYVWKCPEHGEVELFEDLTIAYCPKCGKSMTKVGEYAETSKD